MSTPYAIVNQSLVPAADATLHVSDLSIQRGYGIFDFFKTLGGKPVFRDEHLTRFHHSASRMRLPLPVSHQTLLCLLNDLLSANNLPDSGVRLTLTGGLSPDGYSITTPNLVITQRPLPDNRSATAKGLRLMTADHQRQLPDVKTIDYLMPIWLAPVVREKGADDILYHHAGLISECPRSNIFLITPDNRLVTPAHNILKGVIREKVLALAPTVLQVEERDVRLQELRTAKEVFITSTTKNIIPIISVDSALIASGAPGAVTQQLAALLQDQITRSLAHA